MPLTFGSLFAGIGWFRSWFRAGRHGLQMAGGDRVLIDEDAAPKLRQVEQIGDTHATEQRAEAEMQRLIEEAKAQGEPRACENCEIVKPTSEFYRRGDDWQRFCKVCQSQHFKAYRQNKRANKPEPKLARARA